jgi:hypothetical protein
MGKSQWRQELRFLATPIKCFIIFIGSLLSFAGLVIFIEALVEMTTAPEPDMSSSDYVIVMFVVGVLPFVSGIVLCFFAARKWLKKWWNSGKHKEEHFGSDVSVEKPVDPATAALSRRVNIIINACTIVTVIIGIVVLLKLSNWLASSIDVPSAWIVPIFILPVIVGALLGRMFYKKFLFNKSIEFLKMMSERRW